MVRQWAEENPHSSAAKMQPTKRSGQSLSGLSLSPKQADERNEDPDNGDREK